MATIQTFLTSPVLSVLYRKNYDIQKLSVANIAADLRSIRGSDTKNNEVNDNNDDNNNNIATISNGDTGFNQSKRDSITLSRRSSLNMPIRETVVKLDEQITYAEIEPKTYEQESNNEIVTGIRLSLPGSFYYYDALLKIIMMYVSDVRSKCLYIIIFIICDNITRILKMRHLINIFLHQ